MRLKENIDKGVFMRDYFLPKTDYIPIEYSKEKYNQVLEILNKYSKIRGTLEKPFFSDRMCAIDIVRLLK
jgi:hypothetical protein